jgi:DNA polymerase-3 subunit beta
VKKQGASTVPAKRLLDYVRLLPDGDLQVKIGDNHWANIVAGRSKTRIAGMSRESFPELPARPDVQADLPIKTLAAMISKTIFAISTEESRFTLNGALLMLKPKSIVMVATDGHRLSMVETPQDLSGVSSQYRALLPRKAMAELQKLSSDAESTASIQFAGDENHLFFELGDRLLLSRKLTGNFPEFERVLPKEHPHFVVLARDEFRAAIERVAQFSDERSRAIRLQVAPGEVKVFSSVSETGESEEVIPCTYDGPTVEIGFNAQYLLEFLRAVETSEVSFHFKDPNSAGELRPSGETAGVVYRYVIMPMRI